MSDSQLVALSTLVAILAAAGISIVFLLSPLVRQPPLVKAAFVGGVLGIAGIALGALLPMIIDDDGDGPPATPTATSTATPTAAPSPTGTATSRATPLPEAGTYSGTTSQGRSVEFDVIQGGQAIVRIRFDVEGTCPVDISGPGPQPDECTCNVSRETTMESPWPIAPNGFSYAPGDFEFSAVFDSTTTASGFVRIHTSGTPGGQAPCESGQVTWTATVQ